MVNLRPGLAQGFWSPSAAGGWLVFVSPCANRGPRPQTRTVQYQGFKDRASTMRRCWAATADDHMQATKPGYEEETNHVGQTSIMPVDANCKITQVESIINAAFPLPSSTSW